MHKIYNYIEIVQYDLPESTKKIKQLQLRDGEIMSIKGFEDLPNEATALIS